MKFRNVAISGAIGSGKTTLARNLAEKLGFKYLSTGDFFRKWHKEHDISLEKSEQVPESIDRRIDMDAKKMMEKDSGIVFEAHIAGWLTKDMKDVFKILVTADLKTRMERAAAREGVTIEEALKYSDARAESHRRKFKKLYGIEDRFNPEYFDLEVNTTRMSEKEVLEEVLEKIDLS